MLIALILLQLSYEVWCTDSPNSRNNITINVDVTRNPNAPRFTGLPYDASIPRTYPVATRFFIVNGKNNQLVRCRESPIQSTCSNSKIASFQL